MYFLVCFYFILFSFETELLTLTSKVHVSVIDTEQDRIPVVHQVINTELTGANGVPVTK